MERERQKSTHQESPQQSGEDSLNIIVKHHQISRHTGEVRKYSTSLTESDVREPARGPFYALTSVERNLQPSSSSHRANPPHGQATSGGISCYHSPVSRIGSLRIPDPTRGLPQHSGTGFFIEIIPIKTRIKSTTPLQKGYRQPRIYLQTRGNPPPCTQLYWEAQSLDHCQCVDHSPCATGAQD